MIDYMIRGMEMEGRFRIFAIDSTNTTEEMRKIHQSSAPSSAAMGRILSCSLMMGMMMNNESDKLTMQFKGGGPIGMVSSVVNNEGDIKITATNPQAESPDYPDGKLNVAGVMGNTGTLNVIKDLGLKEPVIGISEMVSGEIGDDMAAYFMNSEQKPSVVALGVLVDKDLSIIASGGYILQLLPNCPESEIDVIEGAVKNSKSITSLISEGHNPEEIIEKVFPMYEIDILDKKSVRFKCDCSDERVERMLRSLGEHELNAMIDEDGGAEVVCQFCKKIYNYDEGSLRNIIENNIN